MGGGGASGSQVIGGEVGWCLQANAEGEVEFESEEGRGRGRNLNVMKVEERGTLHASQMTSAMPSRTGEPRSKDMITLREPCDEEGYSLRVHAYPLSKPKVSPSLSPTPPFLLPTHPPYHSSSVDPSLPSSIHLTPPILPPADPPTQATRWLHHTVTPSLPSSLAPTLPSTVPSFFRPALLSPALPATSTFLRLLFHSQAPSPYPPPPPTV